VEGSARFDFHKDLRYLAIYGPTGALRLVYLPPLIRLASGKTVPLLPDWDPATYTLSLDLSPLSFPLILAFPLSTQLPEPKKGLLSFSFHFPSLRFSRKGDVEEIEEVEEEEEEEAEEEEEEEIEEVEESPEKAGRKFGVTLKEGIFGRKKGPEGPTGFKVFISIIIVLLKFLHHLLDHSLFACNQKICLFVL